MTMLADGAGPIQVEVTIIRNGSVILALSATRFERRRMCAGSGQVHEHSQYDAAASHTQAAALHKSQG